jgi:hypothetical protein
MVGGIPIQPQWPVSRPAKEVIPPPGLMVISHDPFSLYVHVMCDTQATRTFIGL